MYFCNIVLKKWYWCSKENYTVRFDRNNHNRSTSWSTDCQARKCSLTCTHLSDNSGTDDFSFRCSSG